MKMATESKAIAITSCGVLSTSDARRFRLHLLSDAYAAVYLERVAAGCVTWIVTWTAANAAGYAACAAVREEQHSRLLMLVVDR